MKAIQPAIFNTVDGKKPRAFLPTPRSATDPQAVGQILTPVVLKAEQILRGDTKPGALRVVIRGGTIGCYSMDVDVAPTVEVGRRYVFVLADTFDADGKKLLDLPTMRFAWPVDANVVTTSDGAMSLTDLARIVTHASPSPTS